MITNNFIQVPNEAVLQLSGNELKLYILLLGNENYNKNVVNIDDDYFKISIKTLMEQAEMAKRTVCNAIKNLISKGFIKCKKQKTKGGKSCNSYSVNTDFSKDNNNNINSINELDMERIEENKADANKAPKMQVYNELNKLISFFRNKISLTKEEQAVLLNHVEENINLLSDKQRKFFFAIKSNIQKYNSKEPVKKEVDKDTRTLNKIKALIEEVKEISLLDPRTAEYQDLRRLAFYNYDLMFDLYNATTNQYIKDEILELWSDFNGYFIKKDFIPPYENKLAKKEVMNYETLDF